MGFVGIPLAARSCRCRGLGSMLLSTLHEIDLSSTPAPATNRGFSFLGLLLHVFALLPWPPAQLAPLAKLLPAILFEGSAGTHAGDLTDRQLTLLRHGRECITHQRVVSREQEVTHKLFGAVLRPNAKFLRKISRANLRQERARSLRRKFWGADPASSVARGASHLTIAPHKSFAGKILNTSLEEMKGTVPLPRGVAFCFMGGGGSESSFPPCGLPATLRGTVNYPDTFPAPVCLCVVRALEVGLLQKPGALFREVQAAEESGT